MIEIKKIEQIEPIIKNLLCENLGFEFEKVTKNKIRVITPFVYKDNDHIELYFYNKNGNIVISDENITFDKIEMNLFEFEDRLLYEVSVFEIIKQKGIKLDISTLELYKPISQLKNKLVLIRRVLDFIKVIQKLDDLLFYKELKNIIQREIFTNKKTLSQGFIQELYNIKSPKKIEINIYVNITTNNKHKIVNQLKDELEEILKLELNTNLNNKKSFHFQSPKSH